MEWFKWFLKNSSAQSKENLFVDHNDQNIQGFIGRIRQIFFHRTHVAQASSDEGDRLRTVHPSTCPCEQRTKILGSDRPSHGQIRTTDHDNNFEMDEWTDFWPWTVHLMDGLGRILWLPKWSLCISIFHDSLELKFYSWFWAFERIFPRRDIIWMVPRKIGWVIEFLSR